MDGASQACTYVRNYCNPSLPDTYKHEAHSAQPYRPIAFVQLPTPQPTENIAMAKTAITAVRLVPVSGTPILTSSGHAPLKIDQRLAFLGVPKNHKKSSSFLAHQSQTDYPNVL